LFTPNLGANRLPRHALTSRHNGIRSRQCCGIGWWSIVLTSHRRWCFGATACLAPVIKEVWLPVTSGARGSPGGGPQERHLDSHVLFVVATTRSNLTLPGSFTAPPSTAGQVGRYKGPLDSTLQSHASSLS
jgi:hypothetical protein